jgi:hypothetical protein
MRRRRRPRISPGRIEAVLDGTAEPGFDDLLDMIRSVNPTRMGLSAAERAQRYALKAHLQSLLIQRYFEDIAVFPTARAGVVGLRRRAGRGDACHAVVSHLDPEARELVDQGLTEQQPDEG